MPLRAFISFLLSSTSTASGVHGKSVSMPLRAYFISTRIERRTEPRRAGFQCPCGHLFHFYQPRIQDLHQDGQRVSMPLRAFISFLQALSTMESVQLNGFQCPCGQLFHFSSPPTAVMWITMFSLVQCPCGHLFHFSRAPDGAALDRYERACFNALAGIYFISTPSSIGWAMMRPPATQVSMPLRAFISFLLGQKIIIAGYCSGVSMPLRAFISFLRA